MEPDDEAIVTRCRQAIRTLLSLRPSDPERRRRMARTIRWLRAAARRAA